MELINTFGLSDEQKMVRESVLQLLGDVLPWDKIRALDEAAEFPHEAYQALASAGFLGLPYPEEYGGMGGSQKDICNLIETLGYYYTGIAQAVMTTIIYAGMHIVKFGSEDLKREFVPKLIDGSVKLALCMSEPGTGSDVASIKTTAVRDGDDYIVNGNKIWITCGHVADYLVVVTKTDPTQRHKGVSIMLVDAKDSGVTIRPLKMLGRRTTHANEIFFTDVRTPARFLLGEESGAWKNMMSCLAAERLCLAAIATGACFKYTEYARDYATQRVAFGKPITEFQAVSHKLVDMAIMSEMARQSSFRAAELLDGGQDAIKEVSMAKIVATDNMVRCSDLGMQVMGGAGYSTEYDMAMFYRDARVGPIGGGSNEIMRNVLAKRLGMQ